MAVLDELPIEIQHLIFEYLDLIEIFKCRLVSKKLNEIVRTFRVRELSFYDSDWDRKNSWFHNGKPIYPFNSLSVRKASVLRSTSIDLQYLKCLCFYNIGKSSGFSLEIVNRFVSLVDLELFFEDEDWFSGSNFKKLKLLHLRRLYLYFEFSISIEFDAPKLERVALQYQPVDEFEQTAEAIRFATPSTVKWLETFRLRLDQMPRDLKDVERLQYDELVELDIDHLLRTFPALKVLDIYTYEERFGEYCNGALVRIMRARAQLSPSLKICFNNVVMSGSRRVESYGFGKTSKLAALIRHSSSLLSETFLNELNYNELLSLTKNGYPVGFLELQPFHDVYFVSVNDKIDDPDALLWFLLDCVNLKHLKLNNSSLNMEFFEKLPSFTSLLRLDIKAENQDLQLDFAFLFRMTNLLNVDTDQNLNADLVRNLIQKLKFFYWLNFKINGQTFWISKLDNDEFELKNCKENGRLIFYDRDISLENLINYLDDLEKSLNGELTCDLSRLFI